MGKLRAFFAWARRLDERTLGPGGWLPDGMTYVEYQSALARASASPAWVNVSRLLLIAVLFALMRWGGDGDAAVILLIPIFTVLALLSFKAERDIRVEARRKAHGTE